MDNNDKGSPSSSMNADAGTRGALGESPAGLPSQKPSRARFVLIGLLFLMTINTYIDRACISSAADAIRGDLGIGRQEMGYIFGMFAIGYALFQIPGGWLADVFGARIVLGWVVSLWSAFTFLTGLASNFAAMLGIRFVFGASEAGAFPAATRALYNWVPARERGIAQGLFHSGARVGAAVSLFVTPAIIDWVGWRMTFFIYGSSGLLWVLIWMYWFRDLPTDHPKVNAAEADYIQGGLKKETSAEKVPFGVIVTSGNMLLAMFQYVASNITFFISFTWLQPYLVDKWGSPAAYYAPIPLLFGMLAHWISGTLVTWLYIRGHRVGSRRWPAALGFAIGAAGLIATTQASVALGPLVFVLCFSIAVFGVEMTIAPSWSFCMDIGGAKSGAVSGTMNMLGNLGSAFSAIVFPYFVANITVPFFAPAAGSANSFFVFAAIMNLLAFVSWWFMNPEKKLEASVPPGQVRFRLIVFLVAATALVAGPLIYRIFFF
jgi:ACS family glucarate transporter-like MFS transporter